MHNIIRPTILIAMLAIATPASFAATPAASPFTGTWRLDSAASKFGSHPQKTETRIYSMTGDKVTMTSKGTDGAGKPTAYHYSAAYDGKTYPLVGNPIGDKISLKMVDARNVAATVSKGSAVISTSTSSVSADGKRLTLTRKYLGGKQAADVGVYDKQ